MRYDMCGAIEQIHGIFVYTRTSGRWGMRARRVNYLYLSPSFTNPLRDNPLLVACALPPRVTMRAVRTALFPPVTQAVKHVLDTFKNKNIMEDKTREQSVLLELKYMI